MHLPTLLIAETAIGIWFAILFLQAGTDKVYDFDGNLEWLTGHFSATPMKRIVRPMLGTLMLVELIAGLLCAFGSALLVFGQGLFLLQFGLVACCLALLMLFFGQRVAKDYVGSASLAPYFALAIAGLVLPNIRF